MQAAQILAGYSLGQADLLRRAMGKKIKAEMDAQRAGFVEGCLEVNKIPAKQANELFDLIDKFAGYGFNKSHAAAYALLAYQTAWLKAHYAHEFYAASMCFDMDQTDKLAIFTDDMKRLGVQCLPPDINASEADFVVQESEGGLAVRYALAALKGVGEKAMALLVEERNERGRFHSLDDIARRVDPRLLNKRQVETLAGAGAFDGIEPERAGVFAAAETILAVAQRTHENRTSGQGGLFGEREQGGGAISLPKSARWSLADRIGAERDAFGYYFSAHPLDRYQHLARANNARPINTLGEVPIAEGQRVGATVAALIEDARWRTSARGNRYMMATISDTSGQIPVSCFDESTARDMEDCTRAGGCAILTIEMDKRPGEETPRVAIRRVQSFESLASSARLVLDLAVVDTAALPLLAALIGGERGGRCTVQVQLPSRANETAELVLGRNFRIDEELVSKIRALPGVISAQLGSGEGALAAAA
jgi:DNA polymerase-3 subunit alpha